MTPADLLRAARARLSMPNGWTQHSAARDRAGEPIHPRSPQACAWCVLGALDSVCDAPRPLCDAAQAELERSTGSADLVKWNDAPGRTYADVLAALDRGIEAAEETPP